MSIDPELATVQGVAFVDGTYMPLAEATLPLLERGFLRSDVTYDAIHVWNGKIFRLQDHIERFQASIAGLKMSLPYSAQEIADIVTECTRRTGWRDAFIMLICTRGVTPPGTRDPRLCRNRLYAYTQPFARIANDAQQRDGLRMILSHTQRIPSAALDQRMLPTADGAITEGSGFNVFIARNGVLATPATGMFEGITRRTVLEIAASLQVQCEVRAVKGEELDGADEIFISSTAGGVTAVTQFNGKPVGSGKPGPLSTRIHELYWQRHQDDALNTVIDYTTA